MMMLGGKMLYVIQYLLEKTIKSIERCKKTDSALLNINRHVIKNFSYTSISYDKCMHFSKFLCQEKRYKIRYSKFKLQT